MSLDELKLSIPVLRFKTPHPQNQSTLVPVARTCFLANVDGVNFLVTAAHFYDGSQDFKAHFVGPTMGVSLNLVDRRLDHTAQWDVAILTPSSGIDIGDRAPIELGRTDSFEVGDGIFIAGYPRPDKIMGAYGLQSPLLVFKRGVVSAKVTDRVGKAPFFVVDAICDGGMSGGPVIHSATGRSIGVISARLEVEEQSIELTVCASADQVLDVAKGAPSV